MFRAIFLTIGVVLGFSATNSEAKIIPRNIVTCAVVIPAYNLTMWNEKGELYVGHYQDAGDRIIYDGAIPPQIKMLVENPPRHYWGTTKVRVWGCR